MSFALWKLLTSLYWPLWFEALPLSQMSVKNLRTAGLSNALLINAVETRHKINKSMTFLGGRLSYGCIYISELSLKFEILPFTSCCYREQMNATSGRHISLESTFSCGSQRCLVFAGTSSSTPTHDLSERVW